MGIDLNSLIGCLCELKDYDNELIAIGRISAVPDGESSAIDIVSYDGNNLPGKNYGTPVRVNVHRGKQGFLGLEGYVYIAHNSFWRLNNVRCFGENERRDNFRLKTRSKAVLERIIESDEPGVDASVIAYPCIVTSISISGALIAIDDEKCFFPAGTALTLKKLVIGETDEIFELPCRVKRIDKHSRLGRLFGCEFIKLTHKERDRLYQAILKQQRIEIQRRRGTL